MRPSALSYPRNSTVGKMTTITESKKSSLGLLIAVTSAVWVVLCLFVHGLPILAYIVLQAGTSGVFAFSMMKALKDSSHRATKVVSVEKQPAGESAAEVASPELSRAQTN